MITLTLSRRKILPGTTTVKPGQYLIRLRNGMFATQVDFEITADRNRGKATISLGQGNGKKSGIFDLESGDYEVTVRGEPGLRATILVRE